MDILLTHGYFLQQDVREREIMKPYPPLGLLYLSAYLKQKGFAVEVFDTTFAAPEAFAAFLTERQPALVGFYANLMTKCNVLAMLKLAKAHQCRVIVGGPDPPAYAENYLNAGAEVVVIGEGEETLQELIPIFAAGRLEKLTEVRGIVYRDEHGQIRHTPARPLLPDLDALPPPDRRAIALSAYVQAWRRHHGMGSVSLITARGCPYSCTWCSHAVFGHSLRKRSPELVAEEVAEIHAAHQPDMLWYADDVFNINHKWLFAYAAALKHRGLHLPFECICRADRLNEDLVQLLREMGCFRLWLGSESGSQRLLDAMKRGVKAEQVQAMTRLARRHGIETGMFLMWGYEDETREDVEHTIAHVKKANPDLVLTTVSYPIKGTEYYRRMAAQHRVIAPATWETSTDRDHRVTGRHSRRYYDFANRRMYAELELARAQEQGNGSWRQRVRARLQAGIGRLGMVLTAHEREG